MDESGFFMLSLNKMASKLSQIYGLHLVHKVAVEYFTQLKKEEKRIRKIFPHLQQSRKPRCGAHHYEMARPENYSPQGCGEIHYTNQSQAETTLSKYGNGGGTLSEELPSRLGSDGRPHTFNINDRSYLRK